jgi:hypothetical protein
MFFITLFLRSVFICIIKIIKEERMWKSLELVGKKINKLTVLSKEPSREGTHNRSRFKCQCECGNFTIVDGPKLNSGIIKGCGCQNGKQTKNRKGIGEAARNRVISWYKDNAKKRGLPFEITLEKTIELFSLPCFYCGRQPYTTFSNPKYYGNFTYNGIDRLDNTKGYVQENCVSCCQECNYLKNKFSYEEFMAIIKRIYQNRILNQT